MSLQDELSEIASKTEECDDLEVLTQYQKRCEVILTNVTKTLAAEQDPELREHLQEIEAQAKETQRTLKQRLAEVKIARLDPDYEQRKAQKQREEQSKRRQEMEDAQKLLSQTGLGGVLGGIFGAAVGASVPAPAGGEAAGPASDTTAAPAVLKCAQCGAELKPGARFCPECGTPVPREKHCTNCGVKLAPGVKFCPECGSKQV